MFNSQLTRQKVSFNMEVFFAIIGLVFYILPFWFLLRAVRAIEKIANKIEQIPNNESTKK